MPGWIGLRAGLDAVEKRELSCPCRESDHNSPVPQAVTESVFRLSCTSGINWKSLRELNSDLCPTDHMEHAFNFITFLNTVSPNKMGTLQYSYITALVYIYYFG
jgi:hypothetical protein